MVHVRYRNAEFAGTNYFILCQNVEPCMQQSKSGGWLVRWQNPKASPLNDSSKCIKQLLAVVFWQSARVFTILRANLRTQELREDSRLPLDKIVQWAYLLLYCTPSPSSVLTIWIFFIMLKKINIKFFINFFNTKKFKPFLNIKIIFYLFSTWEKYII